MSEYKVGEILFDTAHLDPRFHAELIVRSIEKKADSTIYHCEIIKGYKVGNFVSVREILENTDLKRAGDWYEAHKTHVDALMAGCDKSYPMSGSDISRPELWKAAAWNYFRQVKVPVQRIVFNRKRKMVMTPDEFWTQVRSLLHMGLDLDKAAPAKADGDGAPEIEITPEMIRAGAKELDAFTAQDLLEGYIHPNKVAESVYRAMIHAACAKRSDRSELM